MLKTVNDKEIKRKNVLDNIFDIFYNLLVWSIITICIISCVIIIDQNTTIFSKKKHMENPYYTETFETKLLKKEIESNALIDGSLDSNYYLYFMYNDKLNRCHVDKNVYNNETVGSDIKVKVDITYSTTTGNLLTELYEYIE